MNIGNRRINRVALDAVDPKPGERVLDIGCGGGVALRQTLRRVGLDGRVADVELSSDMIRRAQRRWRRQVESGTLALYEASVEAIPTDDESFDAVYTVNTVYFWSDLTAAFKELRRVTAPGGRVVLAIQPRAHKQWERLYRRDIPDTSQLAAGLASRGFADVYERAPARNVALMLAGKS